MSKRSRSKGQRGERELFALLSDELGFIVRRNVDQARSGGADGLEVPGLAIEVKRRESLSVPTWWAQTCEQARLLGRLPILFYRRNKEPWRCVIPKGKQDWAEHRTDFQSGLAWVRENMGC